jgi:hypothetical protein
MLWRYRPPNELAKTAVRFGAFRTLGVAPGERARFRRVEPDQPEDRHRGLPSRRDCDCSVFGRVHFREELCRRKIASGGVGTWLRRAVASRTSNPSSGMSVVEQLGQAICRKPRLSARALKPGRPLAFTYHHNKLQAYEAVGVAVLDAGLTCSASRPAQRRCHRRPL